jgi:hypothetical protein
MIYWYVRAVIEYIPFSLVLLVTWLDKLPGRTQPIGELATVFEKQVDGGGSSKM